MLIRVIFYMFLSLDFKQVSTIKIEVHIHVSKLGEGELIHVKP